MQFYVFSFAIGFLNGINICSPFVYSILEAFSSENEEVIFHGHDEEEEYEEEDEDDDEEEK